RDGVIQNGAYGHGALGRPDGVAVWQPPDSDLDTSLELEQDDLRDLFGPEAYERFRTYRYFEQLHRQCMECPHWSLTLVGVLPSAQGRGIGGALLAPVLQRADEEGLPCYLETFVPETVPFYEHRGFEVVAAGVHLESRIPYWAMRREPI